MYLMKRTSRKTDANVMFYHDDAFEAYQRNTYQITHDHRIEDGLCMRHIQVWLNENKFKQWETDPRVQDHVAAMEKYNQSNNIIVNEVKANV